MHIPVVERIRPETLTLDLPQMGQVNELSRQLGELIDETSSVLNMGVQVTSIGENDAGSGSLVENQDGSRTLSLSIPSGKTGPLPTLQTSASYGETPQSANAVATPVYTNGVVTGYNIVFTLPKGNKGDLGPAPTLSVNQVQTVENGVPASVTFAPNAAGTGYEATFKIPKGNTGAIGPMPTIDIGTITTLAPGSTATATVTEKKVGGVLVGYTLNLSIPRGAKGETGTVENIFPGNADYVPEEPTADGDAGTSEKAAHADHSHPEQTRVLEADHADTATMLESPVYIGNAEFDGQDNIAVEDLGTVVEIVKAGVAKGQGDYTGDEIAEKDEYGYVFVDDFGLLGTNIPVRAATQSESSPPTIAGEITNVRNLISGTGGINSKITTINQNINNLTPHEYKYTFIAGTWRNGEYEAATTAGSNGFSLTENTMFYVDIDLTASGLTQDGVKDLMKAYSLIDRIYCTDAGYIKAKCYGDSPSINVPVRIRTVG